MPGFVSIVGAGPWDPELLTLAARDRLAEAEVVIADYLVNPATLVHCAPEAQVYQRIAGPHDGPKLDQARVNELMVEHALRGARVVRLKGGDPMIFGRGAEEAAYLREHGVDYEFVPGVSSAVAAPETAGIPVTHREHTPAVSFVSGWEAYEKAGLSVNWENLARSAGTLVLLMSVKNCRTNAAKLIEAGRNPETPAAVVRWGTRGIQRTVVATLATIGDAIDRAGIRAPAVLVVGEVVALREQIAWFESRPLHGRRVLVTRSIPQSAGLLRRLSRVGADAVVFPCLAVAPPEDPGALDAALRRLDEVDGVVVSSPNGARALLDGLQKLELDARALAGRTVAAIGTGTADVLRDGGLRPDLLPERARSEGLVDEMRRHGVLDLRWLHFRAAEGRSLLGEAIEAAGGSYQLVLAYRSVRPEVPTLLLRSLAPPEEGGEGFDAVFFASGKAARHFLETAGALRGEDALREQLAASKVVALGPVTRDAVEALGIRVDAVADATTDEAAVEAIRRALQA